MAEIKAISLKHPEANGIARFVVGEHPIAADGTILEDKDGQIALPAVKGIRFFKHEIAGGSLYVGPCYLVTVEEDFKIIVPKENIGLVVYQNEKKTEPQEKGQSVVPITELQ